MLIWFIRELSGVFSESYSVSQSPAVSLLSNGLNSIREKKEIASMIGLVKTLTPTTAVFMVMSFSAAAEAFRA